ncbi:MAG TPA: SIMPL domain-containing protein [Candidatus Paceibacterota bacterium]|nr:SIMPL domain-containing protein [Candidatus Paceibacterota bacterium]
MHNVMYRRGVTNGIVILGMLLLAGIITVAILRDRIVNQPYREVSITGRGEIAYVPDTARIIMGVQVESHDAQTALAVLNGRIADIISGVTAMGVPEEKISTQNLTVYPQYYYPEDGPSQTSGYMANQELVIEVALASTTDPNAVANIIGAASTRGANQVLGVTFDATDAQELKQQATLAAIHDARRRAEVFADAAGVKLGRVIGWWENPIAVPGQPVPYYDEYGYGGDKGGGYGGPTAPAGTGTIIMEVNVNFSTK